LIKQPPRLCRASHLFPQCIANKEFNALAGGSGDFLAAVGTVRHFFLVQQIITWLPFGSEALKLLIKICFVVFSRLVISVHKSVAKQYFMYSRNARVLLVEDNPADVWLLREALRLAQFPIQLTVARDGVEATRYLRQVELQNSADALPDLVLLDLNLPRKNGREVLADIRRSRVLQTVPIVILSTSNGDEDRWQANELKASGFITKPNSLPAYVEMVRGMEKFWLGGMELRRTA
jgi:CheY-like chemotaxis protein